MQLPNLSAINTNTIEGRALIAALSLISVTEQFKDNQPDDILHTIEKMSEEIFKDAAPLSTPKPEQATTLHEEFRRLINKRSLESEYGNVPDFIIAGFLLNSLQLLKLAMQGRDDYFNFKPFSGTANSES